MKCKTEDRNVAIINSAFNQNIQNVLQFFSREWFKIGIEVDN